MTDDANQHPADEATENAPGEEQISAVGPEPNLTEHAPGREKTGPEQRGTGGSG
jgi:hypothetical protein